MSFNKVQLPEIDELVRLREGFTDDKAFLLHVYKGADAIMGSDEAFDFLDEIENELEKEERKLWDNTLMDGLDKV